jgi:hypothetical protein
LDDGTYLLVLNCGDAFKLIRFGTRTVRIGNSKEQTKSESTDQHVDCGANEPVEGWSKATLKLDVICSHIPHSCPGADMLQEIVVLRQNTFEVEHWLLSVLKTKTKDPSVAIVDYDLRCVKNCGQQILGCCLVVYSAKKKRESSVENSASPKGTGSTGSTGSTRGSSSGNRESVTIGLSFVVYSNTGKVQLLKIVQPPPRTWGQLTLLADSLQKTLRKHVFTPAAAARCIIRQFNNEPVLQGSSLTVIRNPVFPFILCRAPEG